MARIFFALALFAVGLLVASSVVGFCIGDYSAASKKLVEANRQMSVIRNSVLSEAADIEAAQRHVEQVAVDFTPLHRRKTVHVWLGIAAVLVSLLVNAVSVTYFIGTNRWCREVVDAYHLDPALADRSTHWKRKTFPWALSSILVLIVIASLGAAADPLANLEGAAAWVMPHYLAALLGTVYIGWSFLRQVGNIGSNSEIIEQITRMVRDTNDK